MDNYSLYKPLKNHLRKLSINESFCVIWAYSNHLQFGNSFPNDIETIPEFINAKTLPEKRIYQWELELLLREIILNSQDTEKGLETLKKWNYFIGAINKIKEIENKLCHVDKNNVLKELFRLAHRQFPWQLNINLMYFYRYYRIFNELDIDKILYKKVGLHYENLFLMGASLLGHYKNNFIIKEPFSTNIKGITNDEIKKLFNIISIDLDDFKKIIQSEHSVDEKFAYNTYMLRLYPIIKNKLKGDNVYFCPLTTLLYWRFTSGIYYEICREKDFDKPFGFTFQKYVGEVLNKANKKMTIYPEEEYGPKKNKKNTVDWILDEKDAALFIECKTKRLIVPAKIELNDTLLLDKELEKISDAIVQVYKTIKDHIDKQYPSFPYDKKREIYPVILTLEEWYSFADPIYQEIKNKVIEKLRQNGLPKEWLEEMPYSLCGIREFEEIVQIMQAVGIKKFMKSKLATPEYTNWDFDPFVNTLYKKERKNAVFLFRKEFNNILSSRGFPIINY
ncbi:MAG: hypothetical protein HYV53_00250 [Parcubacteria group bacterium]|nr:hypothetical protein [Parcubacteria group bacterium]